jgi:hypothetical protein
VLVVLVLLILVLVLLLLLLLLLLLSATATVNYGAATAPGVCDSAAGISYQKKFCLPISHPVAREQQHEASNVRTSGGLSWPSMGPAGQSPLP